MGLTQLAMDYMGYLQNYQTSPFGTRSPMTYNQWYSEMYPSPHPQQVSSTVQKPANLDTVGGVATTSANQISTPNTTSNPSWNTTIGQAQGTPTNQQRLTDLRSKTPTGTQQNNVDQAKPVANIAPNSNQSFMSAATGITPVHQTNVDSYGDTVGPAPAKERWGWYNVPGMDDGTGSGKPLRAWVKYGLDGKPILNQNNTLMGIAKGQQPVSQTNVNSGGDVIGGSVVNKPITQQQQPATYSTPKPVNLQPISQGLPGVSNNYTIARGLPGVPNNYSNNNNYYGNAGMFNSGLATIYPRRRAVQSFRRGSRYFNPIFGTYTYGGG